MASPRGFHPILFAIYPILALYSLNVAELPFRVTLAPLAVTVVVAMATWVVLSLGLRSWHKGASITSVLIILFFSYGHVYEWLIQAIGMRHRFLLPIWLVLGVSLSVLIARARGDVQRVSRLLDVASAVLVLSALISLGSFGLRHRLTAAPSVAMVDSLSDAVSADAKRDLPDVYYIVVDAYASDSTLREVYQYDNRPFLRRLQERGFRLPDGSRSNYPVTLLSISSSLNMDYLDRLATFHEQSSLNIPIYHRLIRESRVSLALARLGYRQVLINPPWEMFRGDFAYTLWHGSLLNYWEGVEHYRAQTLSVFDQVARIPDRAEPTFTYAHVVCPHPPFVFGPNGEEVRIVATGSVAGDAEYERRLYVDQLRFINLKVDSLIDGILARSRVRPIIVLQSDHGPAIRRTLDDPTPEFIRHRFRNLNAILAPDSVAAHLYPGMSTVNTFRVILRHGFGLPYGRVPDRSFWLTPTQPTVLFRARFN